ncbi:MAG: NAD+ synthase [Actinomycetota bacterium]|nr:NAD+ synthase [Actinomycetota bacterium]
MRIALAQINSVVGDLEGNAQRVLEAWQESAGAGADLVVCPELAITGYPLQDLLLRPELVEASQQALERLAVEGPGGTVAVVGSLTREEAPGNELEWDAGAVVRDDLRNSAAVLADGRLVGVYHKGRLPTYGVFEEERWFAPGHKPLVCNVAGVAVGVTIRDDLWTEEGPVFGAARRGARLVVVLNASPYHRGKRDKRERWVRHHAASDHVWVAYLNAVGGHDGLVFDGDSVVYGPDGTVVARGVQFGEDLLLVDLDIDPAPLQGAPELSGYDGQRQPLPDRQDAPRLGSVAEVWAALVLGTRDYCRRNGFERVVVALSGGIDSSTAACVAVDALGPDNVLAVLLPSRHTSEESLRDAGQLAENLGVDLETLPIDRTHEAFEETLADLFAGLERDETEENIQARIRGVLVMAISNKFDRLVLAAGNKSEAAVGYATLYGDMVGGFAPLIDVYKQQVYELARHRNQRDQVIPENVFEKPPSAELSPGQRDADALPPYDVLDAILQAYLEENRSIDDIVAEGYDQDTVRRVVTELQWAEFKRHQAAPGVRVSQYAFGLDLYLPVPNLWQP